GAGRRAGRRHPRARSPRRRGGHRQPVTARPRLHVVGLGPAGPELVTDATAALLARVRPARLRTDRHPAVHALAAPGGPLDGVESFDALYEQADTLDEVYQGIVEQLVGLVAGAPDGEALYAVPGSPAV